MNQMFVIDIYLNKFKNHFCSINPRFFRYFACGLNGYVGMIDFNSHQWIKYGFVAFAVAIALASLLFSNKLVPTRLKSGQKPPSISPPKPITAT